MTATKITRTALTILKNRKTQLAHSFELYAADCAADRAAGYTPSHCFHGTSRWTDYDNICGGCEDGLTSYEAYLPSLYADAMYDAKAYWTAMEYLRIATRAMLDAGLELDFFTNMDKLMKRYGIA